MKKRYLLAIPVLVILVALFIGNKNKEQVVSDNPKSILTEVEKPPTPDINELYKLTNDERSKVGVKPLELSPLLNESAQLKADDMATNKYFDHVNPSTGKSGATYITDVGMVCRRQGENITLNIHANTASAAINAFMASTPHRNAILNPEQDYVGFGINGINIVQHFCNI